MHASVTLLFITKKPDFEGQSVIKASSYLLPFVLEAHRESLPRSCETSARRLSAESAEVYSTADLSASAAHIPFSGYLASTSTLRAADITVCVRITSSSGLQTASSVLPGTAVLQRQLTAISTYTVPDKN